jgi:hypothetical protein
MGQNATTTHTPGPLVILRGTLGDGWDIETREGPGVDAKLVARVNRREDAVLFAAAAGMFDALQELLEIARNDNWSGGRRLDDAIADASAALAPVEGSGATHAVASPFIACERPRTTYEQAVASGEAIAKHYDIDADFVWETIEIEDAPRFILCETSRENGDAYFTGHESPQGAVEYSAAQEDADRWKPDGLYDVAAGKWVAGEVTAMVEHSATFEDRGAA